VTPHAHAHSADVLLLSINAEPEHPCCGVLPAVVCCCVGVQARLLEHVKQVAEAGNPQAVLDAIDHYAHSQEVRIEGGVGGCPAQRCNGARSQGLTLELPGRCVCAACNELHAHDGSSGSA
jgi:hypothetical protein